MTTQTTAVPHVDPNDGNRMPQLGFGVFQVPPEDTLETVAHALQTGYRAIDTAAAYGNEDGVRDGLNTSGLDRGEVFITTKLRPQVFDFELTDDDMQALSELDRRERTGPDPDTFG